MNFEFATSTKIIFGRGTARQLPQLISSYGAHPLLIMGSQKIGESLLDSIYYELIDKVFVEGEPTLPVIEEIINQIKDKKIDCVVAIGGGSTIDTGKAVAGLLSNPGDITDYLEVVGKGLPLSKKPFSLSKSK